MIKPQESLPSLFFNYIPLLGEEEGEENEREERCRGNLEQLF